MAKTSITDLLTDLSKKHGLKLGTASEVIDPVVGLSTGNLAIDHITGVGGIPLGRTTELFGLPSSGKTTTALQTAAKLQSKIIAGKTEDLILFLDFEHALDAEYAAKLGLDIDHPSVIIGQPKYIEQGARAAMELINTGRIRLSIWDSVASFSPEGGGEEFDRRTEAMERARVLNAVLRRMNSILHANSSAAIFLNHMTEIIDMGGRPGLPPRKDSPGGKGLKYYSSLRLSYEQLKQVKGSAINALTNDADAELVIAQHIKVKVVKNKVAPMAFRDCEVRSRFGRGFDNTWSAIQVLVDHRYIQKNGAWFVFDRAEDLKHPDLPTTAGKLQLRGEAAVEEFARTHPAWRDIMIARAVEILDSYRSTEDMFIAEEEQ